MSKEKSNINWDLIAKHLVGETGSVEEAQLTEWINGDEANRKFFAELEDWWRQAGQLALYSKVDTEADWRKLSKRLKLHKPECRMRGLRLNIFERYPYLSAVAAVVALLITVGTLYYGLRDGKAGQNRAAFSQIIVPAGQRSQMLLADGTTVWLNSGSSLMFPADFDSERRMVKLEGEAYFEVTAVKNKPFVVQTSGLEVKVYGTSFNVMSYPNDASEEIALLSGSVSVAALDGGNEIVLKPGQRIIYTRDEYLFTGPVPTDEETVTAWLDGKLVFNDIPFGEIAKKLERRYGLTIRIDDKNIEQSRYRGAFGKETLEQAIRALQLTANFKYRIEDNVVVIYN